MCHLLGKLHVMCNLLGKPQAMCFDSFNAHADRHNQRKKKKPSCDRLEMVGTRAVAPYEEEVHHENGDLEKGLLAVNIHAKSKEEQETSHTHGA
jgi:hypothetical protein